MSDTKTCSICGFDFDEYGNNPAPFPWENGERCCNDCNVRFVVPSRIITNPKITPGMLAFLAEFARMGKVLAMADIRVKEMATKKLQEKE